MLKSNANQSASTFRHMTKDRIGEKTRPVEAPGIDPGTSRMLSERSTI